MSVKPIPDGYEAAIPYLCCKNAARALAFYAEALGAEEVMRMPGPDDRVGHAEIRIGDARIMLADEFPEMDVRSPESIGGSPVMIHLYVDDVDRTAEGAVAAGMAVLRPVQDQFYGDRLGVFRDPFGHRWSIASRKEELSIEEIRRRGEAHMRDAH